MKIYKYSMRIYKYSMGNRVPAVNQSDCSICCNYDLANYTCTPIMQGKPSLVASDYCKILL